MQSNQRQHYPGLRQAAVMPILCRVVSIGVAVVATPVVLRELGEKGFGLWATLFGVSSMVGIAQQAVCGTALFLAAKHGQEDHRCASKIVTAVLLVAVVTTVGGLVFADITAEFWVQILSETPAEKGVVYAIIPCIAVSAGMLVMSHGLIGLIIGFGRPTTGSVFLAVHQVVFYLVA